MSPENNKIRTIKILPPSARNLPPQGEVGESTPVVKKVKITVPRYLTEAITIEPEAITIEQGLPFETEESTLDLTGKSGIESGSQPENETSDTLGQSHVQKGRKVFLKLISFIILIIIVAFTVVSYQERLRIAREERIEKQRTAKEEAEEMKRLAKEEAEEIERLAKEEAEKKRVAREERIEEQRIAKEEAENEWIAKAKVEKQRIAKEEELSTEDKMLQQARNLHDQGKFKEALDIYLTLEIDEPVDNFYIALIYRYGLGVNKDINEALNYYKKAADLGHEFSKSKYRELKKAADLGHQDAKVRYKELKDVQKKGWWQLW